MKQKPKQSSLRDELNCEITERKRAEKTARISEAQHRAVLQSTLDGIVSADSEGNTILWNKGAENIFGYSEEEILGKPLTVLMPERYRGPHRQGLERFSRTSKGPTIGKVVQLEGLRKDGSEFPLELSISAWKQEEKTFFTAIVRDITERKRAEGQIKLQATALNAAANAITITDRKGFIQWVNPAFVGLTGYSLEELVGKTPRILKSGQQGISFYQEMWQTILTGKPWHGELVNRRKDGKLYFIELLITPVFDEKGEIVNLVGISQDITERKQAEEKIEKAMAVKSEFTSMVSHELRTPLSVIKEGVAVVSDQSLGPLNSKQQELLNVAQRNVERLARLINDVLDFQRLDLGEMELKCQPCDINSLVGEACQFFRMLAEQKGLELVKDLTPGFPQISLDKDKIMQVLINLLNNAVKFSGRGKITVRTQKLDNTVKVIVQDEGIGIRAEDQPKLFQSFTQIATEEARKTGSSGLGLAISKKIVELHRGRVGVESAFGKGSAFFFLLPIRERRG